MVQGTPNIVFFGEMELRSLFFFFLLTSVSFAADPSPRNESFDDFFIEFMENQEFQKSRIQFPLSSVTVHMETEKFDTVKVEKNQWKYNDFKMLRTGLQVRQFDNFDRKLRESDERVVSLIGNDNGLLYSYFYKRIDGRWMLVRILDESS